MVMVKVRTHVSVFLHLMKGPHDDKLEQSGHWPLRGTFTIELLNQLSDSNHYSRMVQFLHDMNGVYTNRVLEGVKPTAGGGITQFISHDTLLYHNISGYYRNEPLIFRISYEDAEPPYQVAPVTIKVAHFSQRLKHKGEWYSGPFFAFDEGYKVYLNVDPAGYGDGEGTHVSVFLHLMKGPYDDKLEQSGHWPLRGTLTIELLNQLNDSDHYRSSVKSDPSESVNRVMDNNGVAIINFVPQFISHDILFQHNGYLRNDLLNFQVSYLANKDDDDTSS